MFVYCLPKQLNRGLVWIPVGRSGCGVVYGGLNMEQGYRVLCALSPFQQCTSIHRVIGKSLVVRTQTMDPSGRHLCLDRVLFEVFSRIAYGSDPIRIPIRLDQILGRRSPSGMPWTFRQDDLPRQVRPIGIRNHVFREQIDPGLKVGQGFGSGISLSGLRPRRRAIHSPFNLVESVYPNPRHHSWTN